MSTDVSVPDAVFFDWDGTLVDSFAFLQSAHDHVLTDLGLPAREAGWFSFYFGKDRDFIYRDIYGEALVSEAMAGFEAFVAAYHVSALRPMVRAADVLAAFDARGVTQGIVTNKKGDFVRKEIEAFGWGAYFDGRVVGAGEARVDKPSSAPLVKAVTDSGLEGRDIWFVGDSAADYLCAKEYGCPFILIAPPGQVIDFCEPQECLAVFDGCEALRDFISQLA